MPVGELHIRADGTTQMGMGHLVRCFALAQMLRNQFEIQFFCREIPSALAAEITAAGFEVNILPGEADFLENLSSEHLVVLDGYHFTTAFQQSIKDTGALLICIDDLHEIPFVADLVINTAPGIDPSAYDAADDTVFALGPGYALLRPAFLEQAKKPRTIPGSSRTILICFGGSDSLNLTEKTLKTVREFGEFNRIIVVTGSGYTHQESLQKYLETGSRSDRIIHRSALNETEMIATMLECELAIVPASGILAEVIAVGCIPVSGIYIQNQRFIYEQYKEANAFIDAGTFEEPELKSAIQLALATPLENPIAVGSIDGKSGERLLKLALTLCASKWLELRLVSAEDLETTFQWASNPLIRAHSFSQQVILPEEHAAWFERKLADKKCIYYVAELNGKPAGTIRFDLDEGEALISYLVDPDFHGLGLGQALIESGMHACKIEAHLRSLPLHCFAGFVIPSNIPSVKTFENLKFEKIPEGPNYKFVCYYNEPTL